MTVDIINTMTEVHGGAIGDGKGQPPPPKVMFID